MSAVARTTFGQRSGRVGTSLLLLLLLLSGLMRAPLAAQSLPHVRIVTTRGDIIAEVDSIRAPISSANFLRYVDAGAYRDGHFHRTVRTDNQPDDATRIAVIQGGRARADAPRFPPIPLERTSSTGLRHRDGTLSMARGGPDTATSDFFVCIGDQPSLDFGGARNPDGQGFAAFGRVVQGMEIVRAIQEAPAQAQRLTPAIAILDVHRIAAPHP